MTTAVAVQNDLSDAVAAARPAPIDMAAHDAALTDATVDFMLLAFPLIEHVARGEKRATLRAAYQRLAALHFGKAIDDRRLPAPRGTKGVALALHRTAVEVCKHYGIGYGDLIDAYNAAAASAGAIVAGSDPLVRLRMLVALLVGEELAERGS